MRDVLIWADTLRSAEMRHEVPFAIGDSFLYLEADGRRIAVLPGMEIARLREADASLELCPLEELGVDELVSTGQPAEQVMLELALRACRRFGVAIAAVPAAFPLELADFLRGHGVELKVDRETFSTRRRVKNAAELAGIRRAQRAAEAGMAVVRDMLRRAEPHGGVLRLDGATLTCERIKVAVEAAFGEHGATAEEIIVSRGPQTAVGHDAGSGPIAPGDPVLADLFPRDRESGCFADMTRTFAAPGAPPSEELLRYHALCGEALQIALSAVRPGVTGRELHQAVCDLFHSYGFPTQLHKEPDEVLDSGFYHALGHGVGLEVHEQPWLSRTPSELVAGDVIAIEPGLYRAGVGGCRLEDLVLVTEHGCENLTSFPYDLEP